MEWQTRLPTGGRKRPNDAALHEFRARQSQSPAQLSVSHAEASGASRMLTGSVGGDNVHGNVSHVTNYYNSNGTPGARGINEPDSYHNYSSVLSDSEKENLFKTLHFPQLDSRLTNLRRAGRRTCEWLLRRRDYQQWMNVDSKHFQFEDGLFWIRGNPGTGKSIAMKFLFQRMQQKLKRSRDNLVLSFFFNARGSDHEKSTLGLYRSLLFGLISSDQSLLDALDHCSRSQYLSILSGEWEQKHEPLLQELCEKAVDLLTERKKRLYFYVDALDECPEHQVRDMVVYFESLMAEGKSTNIRVCFSSRHYPRISIKTKLAITLEHETKHNDDIKMFIGSELRFDDHADQTEVDRLQDAIFQRSAGIFLWVSLVVRQLNDVFDNDGRMDAIWERLEEIPKAAKETPLSHGDLPLYGLFQDVILKDKKNIPDLVRLTQLIFCARRPLRPQEAFVALHESYNEPFDAEKVDGTILSKHILAISKGLAEVTRAEHPTVQFIHETVREFLRDRGLSGVSKQSMHGDGNEVLKSSCLDQINELDAVAKHFELLEEYRAWRSYRDTRSDSVTARQREEFREKAIQMFPFLEYSTQYILPHANAAAGRGVPQKAFLSCFPLRLWVPLHNLFEKTKVKHFDGPYTPIPYILAGYGLNDLLRFSMTGWNYAASCKNEQCPTILHNAIYSGNMDTAWVLVGLDPKDRRPRLDEPRLSLSGCRKTLLRAIVDADDVVILGKVKEDLGVDILQSLGVGYPFHILNDCRSAAMIDCLIEHSMLPEIYPAEEKGQHDDDIDENIPPASELFFIRRAIAKYPNVLSAKVWNRMSMLDYATDKRIFPLLALSLEFMHFQGLATLNECLERAAMVGCLIAVKEAHSRGADLDRQDESGQTILHKMFSSNGFRKAEPQHKSDMCSVLRYLLLKSSKLGASVDRDGHTAFDLVRNDLWGDWLPPPEDSGYKQVLEVFVKAGAATRTGFICKDHQYPWVAVLWVSVKFAMQLAGEKRFSSYNLNARDSLGRTALSWCFRIPPNASSHGHHLFYKTASDKGLSLLKFSDVDVNSRDDSGRTILEYLIRHPAPHAELGGLTVAFFNSSALDVNLGTSDGHSPLDLIISLYGTWPLEFGDIDSDWTHGLYITAQGMEKRLVFSASLVRTTRLLLATRKVDISEQKRCLAKAPDALQGLILESIKEVEPDYRFQIVIN